MIKKLSAILLAGMLLVVGCSNSNTTDTETNVSEEPPKKVEVTFPGIGETVSVDGLDITVNGVKQIENGNLITLDEGQKLFAIDITMTNNRAENYIFSSLAGINAINEEGYECSLEMFSEHKVKPLDGDIPSGITKRGEHVFKSTSDLAVVTLTPDLGGEAITFKLK